MTSLDDHPPRRRLTRPRIVLMALVWLLLGWIEMLRRPETLSGRVWHFLVMTVAAVMLCLCVRAFVRAGHATNQS